jgi:hypothetical protein
MPRAYFHISKSYGISENNCYYTIRFIEELLIESGQFTLSGRKALTKRNIEFAKRLLGTNVCMVDLSHNQIGVQGAAVEFAEYLQERKRKHAFVWLI